MKFFARKQTQRVTNFALAAMLVVSTLAASVPFLFAEKAAAASSAVYVGLPAAQPATYPSIGFAATSTKELGDRVTLAGSNRHLDNVTVSLTSWACQNGQWNFNNCATTPGATFQQSVTANVYAVNSDGTVGSVVATKTQTVNAQYRPSADPTCIDGNVGKWRADNGVCYNGKAFDVNFDFYSQHKTLPNDVIVTVAYDGNASEAAKSLNVSLATTSPTVGADFNTNMYEDTTYNGTPAGLAAGDYTGYHGAFNITASPTNVAPTATFNAPTPADGYVHGTIDSNTTFSDDYGMTGYTVRFWKDAFEVAGGGTLVKDCSSYPGGYLLGTTQNVSCALDVSSYPNGTKFFLSAQVLDGDGVWGNTVIRSYTVDNTKPVLYVKSGANNVLPSTLASNTFKTVSFKLYDNVQVDKVTINGVVKDLSNAQWSDVNGVTKGVFGATEGANTIVVYDVAGNTTSYSFVIDTTAPNVPTVGLPNGTYKNTASGWNYTWSDESATGAVRYEYQASQNGSLNSGALVNGIWNSVANGDSSQNPLLTPQIPSVGTSDGKWFWQVRAIDSLGNTSAWSELWNVTVDTIAPNAPVVTATGVASGASTKQGSVEILWTKPSSDTVSYNYIVWTNAVGSDYNSEANAYPENGLTGNSRSGAFTEGQGTYFVRVQAVDAANNKSPWSNTFSVVYDTTAPITSFSTPATTVGNDATIAIEGSTGDSASYVLSRSDLAEPVQTGETFTSYDFDTTDLESGDYTFSLVATDAAGNTSESVTVTMTVDNTAPSVVITVPATTLVADTTPTINGTFDNNQELVTDDTTILVFIDGSTTGAPAVKVSGNTWSFTPEAALSQGSHTFVAVATDSFGNTSVASNVLALTIDTAAPALTVNPTSDNATVVTGTAELGSTLLVTFNGGTQTAVENINGNWTFTLPTGLAVGTYAFSITATDAAANTSTSTATVTIAPAQTVVTPLITNPAAAVLGATTDNDATGAADVKGATDDKAAAAINSDANQGKIFGLAWYWWILILAALAAIGWFIVAAIRRRNEEQA